MILRSSRMMLALLLLSGCGGGGPPQDDVELNPVTGSIKVDGKPAQGVTVGFRPDADTVGKGGYAVTGADGSFTITYHDGREGLPAGKYYIILTWITLPDGSPLPKDAMAADVGAENRLPANLGGVEDNPNFAAITKGENPPFDISVTSVKRK